MNKYDELDGSTPVKRIEIRPIEITDDHIQTIQKTDSQLFRVCAYIIVNEFCERLTYYSILGNLALYLTRELSIESESTDFYVNIFTALVYLTPLIGGYVADAYLGRYRTILLFIIIYAIGACTLSYSTFVHEYNNNESSTIFVTSLLIVALGSGGIKPNVSTLGADQLENAHVAQSIIDRYFNYFYMSINVGAIISYTIIAYICQNVSFTIGFAIPAISIIVGTLVFYSGRQAYVHIQPSGSMISLLIGILYYSYTLRNNASPNNHVPIDAHETDNIDSSSNTATTQHTHFTDVCRASHGGPYTDSQVQDVQYLFRLMPFISLFILYWGIYSQMNTTFFNQGCLMNLNVAGIQFPIAALNLFDAGIIIIFVPLFDFYLYPFITNTLHIKLTTLRKIGAGFIVVSLAMACAAVVEISRLHKANNNEYIGASVCFKGMDTDSIPQSVDMSILYQAPQFILVGISEVLASATSLELFYTEAPSSMKSLCSAFSLITTSLGSLLVGLLVPIVNSGSSRWITHDANYGHLDYYWWLLSGLMVMNAVMWIYVATRYEYKATLDARLQQTTSAIELTPNNKTDNNRYN